MYELKYVGTINKRIAARCGDRRSDGSTGSGNFPAGRDKPDRSDGDLFRPLRDASVAPSANSGRMRRFARNYRRAAFCRDYVVKSFAVRQTIGANSLIA